ncbi:hypothetical protein [Kibdelosporangium phytohabitans]|uniref:Uncharacterized protein n=1 Tax=Kibdelosporangium phytohabitans TaxID=860235 RepID=A0A0N9I2H3_9PSEU|nr:hypothetical protein [Kibdelosporangium phytohabitans]ALG11896.1 hypothetical protein AOZ06_38025 [Kibdelosporangium phytohabitans]MBE1463343.1 hypothetical protein [Kibdelosporangium phytohabitans]
MSVNEEEDPPQSLAAELIRASAPAIYGRSWVPYVRLLILLVVLAVVVIGARELFSPAPAPTSTTSNQ